MNTGEHEKGLPYLPEVPLKEGAWVELHAILLAQLMAFSTF